MNDASSDAMGRSLTCYYANLAPDFRRIAAGAACNPPHALSDLCVSIFGPFCILASHTIYYNYQSGQT